jgi:hypothetical protein
MAEDTACSAAYEGVAQWISATALWSMQPT